MKLILIIVSILTLSSCKTLDEFIEGEPYQSPMAERLEVDESFTYESIQEGKIAFINLNFTVPRGGRGIDIDDQIGADIPPYTFKFHEYLQKRRADIPWVGPLEIYSRFSNEDYKRLHYDFTVGSDRLYYWLDRFKNKKNPIARYVATADRIGDESVFLEIRDGYKYDLREMTIKLDVFDTKTNKRVWSGVISGTSKQRRGYNDEMWLFSRIALDFVSNFPTADALIPLQNN